MPDLNGQVSIKKWIVIGSPIAAFLVGVLAVGAWKGEVTSDISALKTDTINNTKDIDQLEQTVRDEMWALRTYVFNLDKNILVIATTLNISEQKLSRIKIDIAPRIKRASENKKD